MLYKERSPRSNFIILAVIVGIALVVSIFSYQFFILACFCSSGLQKLMEIGTIIGNKAYSLQYIADALRYSEYLPAVQNIAIMT